MSIRTRAGALLAGGALVASGLTLAGPTPGAHAADNPSPEALAATAWLKAQLVDGLLSGNVAQTVDFGLSTLASATDTPELLAQLGAGIESKHDAIAAGGPTLVAEVVTFQAQVGSADSGFAQTVADATDATGKFDSGQAYQQVWGVSALHATGNAEADAAVAYLRGDQCASGAWGFGTACGDGTDYDTTARAVLALLPFDEDPQVSAAIDKAVAWLESELAPDGGIGESPYTPINTQSTGLVAWALGEAASPGAARAASFVAARQLVRITGCASPLDAEHGAIAYSDEDVKQARTDGKIDPADRGYQWIWPSAQALAGLAYLSDPVAGRVYGPTGYVRAGTTVTVRSTGLRTGQPACLAGFGNARAIAGPGYATVKLPAATGNRVLALRWLGGGVTTTIKTLGAKTFRPKVRGARVKRGGLQVVTVTGLAPAERFTVRYAGRTVRTATATSTGVARVSFRVGRVKGLKSAVVLGQFSDRRGTTTFRVVR